MSEELQKQIAECGVYLEKATNTGLSGNERDIYYLIDELVKKVNSTYPYAPCKDKCSSCCKSYGLPRVTAIEWQNIHKFLLNDLPEEKRKSLIEQTKRIYLNQIPALLEEQERIKISYTRINPEDWPKKPDLKNLQCPFLVDDSCSIYQARPAICRSYGFFSIKRGEHSSLFTCNMAAEEIFARLKERGIEYWALPIWNKFSDKLYELNGKNAVATLPLWIFSHLDANGDLSPVINRNPEFNKLVDFI